MSRHLDRRFQITHRACAAVSRADHAEFAASELLRGRILVRRVGRQGRQRGAGPPDAARGLSHGVGLLRRAWRLALHLRCACRWRHGIRSDRWAHVADDAGSRATMRRASCGAGGSRTKGPMSCDEVVVRIGGMHLPERWAHCTMLVGRTARWVVEIAEQASRPRADRVPRDTVTDRSGTLCAWHRSPTSRAPPRPPTSCCPTARRCSPWSPAAPTRSRCCTCSPPGRSAPARRSAVLHVNHLLRGDDADADAAFVAELCAALGVACRVGALRRRRLRRPRAPQPRGRRPPRALPLRRGGARRAVRRSRSRRASRPHRRRAHPRRPRRDVPHARDRRRRHRRARLDPVPARPHRAPAARLRPRAHARRGSTELGAGVARGRDQRRHHAPARARARTSWCPSLERLNPGFRATLARTIDLLGDDDALLERDGRDRSRGTSRTSTPERAASTSTASGCARSTARWRGARCARRFCEAFPEASRLECGARRGDRRRPRATSVRARPARAVCGPRPSTVNLSSRARGEAPRAVAPSLLPHTRYRRPRSGGAHRRRAGRSRGHRGDARLGGDRCRRPGRGSSSTRPRPGDRMRPLGMEGTRKLSDLLTDAKVPRRDRAATAGRAGRRAHRVGRRSADERGVPGRRRHGTCRAAHVAAMGAGPRRGDG